MLAWDGKANFSRGTEKRLKLNYLLFSSILWLCPQPSFSWLVLAKPLIPNKHLNVINFNNLVIFQLLTLKMASDLKEGRKQRSCLHFGKTLAAIKNYHFRFFLQFCNKHPRSVLQPWLKKSSLSLTLSRQTKNRFLVERNYYFRKKLLFNVVYGWRE